MKIKRISYLFVLCPALLVGMTSCGKASEGLPGKALSYEEVYEQVKKTAPEYNMRTSLSKSIDINLGIDEFTIDGKVTLPQGGEPTNIRFTIPKQDDFKLTLKNETGVEGALEVRERLKEDALSTYTSNSSAPRFGGNFLYNCLFNPFFTTFTLSYVHTMIDAVRDINIINENYSLDGETVYVSYSIPDLKTFTDLANEYELSQMTRLFTVFRGSDGNAALTLAFDKYGYLSNLGLKAYSNDIALIGDMAEGTENFRGYAHVNFNAKIKQNFYAESEYRTFTASDLSSNADLNIRSVASSEYEDLGFKSRALDVGFVQDVLDNYSDVILPGYGVDFAIEHPGKESTYNNLIINIDGINYPVSDFIERAENDIVYSWHANHATTDDGVTINGRSIIDNQQFPDRHYFADEGYTLLPDEDIKFENATGYYASLLDEMLKFNTSDGHVRNSIDYKINQGNPSTVSSVKQFITFEYYDPLDPIGFYPGRTLHLDNVDDKLPYENQNFASEINALPWGYALYNFTMSDGGVASEQSNPNTYGIVYANDKTTRTNFAEIDGKSHGILDIYHNLDKDGNYVSPTIKAARGFKFNDKIADKEELKSAILNQFIISDEKLPLTSDSIADVEFVDDTKTNEHIGFKFTIDATYIEEARQMTEDITDSYGLHRAATFRLVDCDEWKYNPLSSLFIKEKPAGALAKGDTCYIDFNLVVGNPSGVVHCYDPNTGLEEGTSLATVDEAQIEGQTEKILKFEDFTIRADDGYLISSANPQIYYFSDVDNKYHVDTSGALNSLFTEFGKQSKDNKEMNISMDNFQGSENDKINILHDYYEFFNGKVSEENKPFSQVKIILDDGMVAPEPEPIHFNAANGEGSSAYMNIVPGPDYTYVQILPNYTNIIDKDLKFVFDF